MDIRIGKKRCQFFFYAKGKKGVSMRVIEIVTRMGKNGMIQISENELLDTGLKEGDEICLSYLEQPNAKVIDEFLIERKG